ncbi:MAG: glycosyltransferase family 4 protein [candidate division WOR-3 bacterium]|nr:glycosyltransferase family 4 protein [candidate division WOR-3 bacterium]
MTNLEIMYIYNVFPQFRTLAGGERLSLKILEEVAKFNHKVEIVTLSIDNTCQGLLPKEIKIIETSPWMNLLKNHFLKVLIEHVFVYKTAQHIPKNADIVFFHKSSSLPALFYFKRIRKSPIPAVYFSFEPPRFAYDLKRETLIRLGPLGILVWLFLPIFKYLDRKLATICDEMITYSNFMKEWLESIYKKPISKIVPLGIETKQFEKMNPVWVREKYNFTDKDKIVITSNKLHHRKRVDLLINAMAFVKKEIPEVKALILGTGPEEKNLKSLTKKLKLEETIIFCGHIGDEIPDYYASADLYVHPGKNEPFGLSVIEAQMAGVPVVSVREGEPLTTVIEGRTGAFAQSEPKDLAKQIIALLKDDKLRIEMGHNARRHVASNYTWQISAKRFMDVCRKYQN